MSRSDVKRIIERISGIAAPICESVGVDLYWVELTGSVKRPTLRIYIDALDGAGIEDCVAVSKRLSPALDVEDVLHGSYDLEVSSPGVNRVLRNCEDFSAHQGMTAKVRLCGPIEGRRNFKGRIRGCDEGRVLMEVDGREIVLPLEDIERANIEFEF